MRRELLKNVLLTVVCACVCVAYGYCTSQPLEVLSARLERKLPIYSVDIEEKRASLGFNCAWDNADIPQLIEILAEQNVKATFFLAGDWCDNYPESARALAEAGHEIGSHSNTHKDMAKLDQQGILDQISRSEEKITALCGKKPNLFRMPSGSYNNLVIETLGQQGYYAIQWDCDSIDYKNPTPTEMRDRVLKKLRPGSITLFHSGAKNTPAALPMIIEAARAQGYEFVPVSELIFTDNYTIDFEGRQHGK